MMQSAVPLASGATAVVIGSTSLSPPRAATGTAHLFCNGGAASPNILDHLAKHCAIGESSFWSASLPCHDQTVLSPRSSCHAALPVVQLNVAVAGAPVARRNGRTPSSHHHRHLCCEETCHRRGIGEHQRVHLPLEPEIDLEPKWLRTRASQSSVRLGLFRNLLQVSTMPGII